MASTAVNQEPVFRGMDTEWFERISSSIFVMASLKEVRPVLRPRKTRTHVQPIVKGL